MADNARPCFLLLAPPPPQEYTLAKYKEVYGETVAEVLKECASQSEDVPSAAVLEIALACPQLLHHSSTSRAKLYTELQTQLASLYKLVVIIAARDNVSVEDSNGVDVRIIPVAWSPSSVGSTQDDTGYGPIVTLHDLARCKRPWQFAFGVESDEGAQMVEAFVAAKAEIVTEGSTPETSARSASSGTQLHHDVAVGGTFDHLHIGHKLLLTMTLFAVDFTDGRSPMSVTIGITGDELLKNKKYAEVLESWETRQQHIEDFCDSLLDFTAWPAQKAVNRRSEPVPNGTSIDLIYGNGLDVRCTQIQDPFGPTITDRQISALVISGETRAGGKAVNEKREEKGWPGLEIFEVAVLDADEEGVETPGFDAKLSSTAIRQKIASKT